MGKFILIKGSGLGKTVMMMALRARYMLHGIPCKCIVLDEAEHNFDQLAKFKGYVIVETNRESVPFEPWQTITIEGGQPFAGMMRF